MDWSLLLAFAVNGILVGALYGVVAMCFVLIYKATQILNFAQGEFLLIGAWICWATIVQFGLPFWLGFLVTLAFMFLFGVLLQMVVLRPMIGEPIISVIMLTIGLSIVFRSAMNWIFGSHVRSFPAVFDTDHVEILGLNVQMPYVLSFVLAILVVLGFFLFFKYSRMGLAMRATAFDQQVAQSLGVSVERVFALSWAISAMASALAGVVIGMVNGVSSSLAFYGIKVFPAVIVGGLDSIVGGMVGGLIVGVIENLAAFADTQYLHWGNLLEVVPFYVLIIILMVKPYGLFGTEDIERI
ncbi:branched-chain amino acid ABC transporter permease [Castellaniella sp.]|uniref:branched-chain amino acid ABC transporter permease n=1 Tax=Castellaniella sp. TaxID=1955812 RepID=UPI00355F1538